MSSESVNSLDDIILKKSFVPNPIKLYHFLLTNVNWDSRMKARKTASYGVAYNYSQMSYPYQEFLSELSELNHAIAEELGFIPNNCLINYYPDGKSKMGFHSDQTDILLENTGVAIISVGDSRILRFRSISNHDEVVDYQLPSGSLFYMSQKIQDDWQHAIPKSDSENGRISLTFRHILS